MQLFVHPDFEVPDAVETPDLRIRPLRISDVVKDYDAVMTSADHLQGAFGPAHDWPFGLTFEQDLIDLGWHHKEFQRRSSFAYTVMDRDESQCLGCVYINPSDLPGYDAAVYCWIRASRAADLDAKLYAIVRSWLETRWPFKSVAYPGRAISWAAVAEMSAGQ